MSAPIGEHRYTLTATWTGDRGTGTSGYRDYSRDVMLHVDGKPELLGSADRPFRGDGERWNPEDMLLGALSQCHLLSYLHACVEAGVVVRSYRDQASGVMQLQGPAGAFVEVVLRPEVTVAQEDMVAAAVAAHESAHEWCFIANSVNFPVRVEPQVSVARAGAHA